MFDIFFQKKIKKAKNRCEQGSNLRGRSPIDNKLTSQIQVYRLNHSAIAPRICRSQRPLLSQMHDFKGFAEFSVYRGLTCGPPEIIVLMMVCTSHAGEILI